MHVGPALTRAADQDALGMKITDLSGERISFSRAAGRFFAEILSSLTLGIG
jgi:hypothetical protein